MSAARLRIQSLRFDRNDPNGASLAMPVREHSQAAVPSIDWERSSNVVSTAVAYSSRLESSAHPTLRVTISILATLATAVLVRARAREPFPFVGAGPVEIPASQPAIVERTLAIDHRELAARGVSDVVLEWLWEFSDDGGDTWREFDRTKHRVFVLLDDLASPWGRPGAAGRVVPWLDVLDIACRWAARAHDEEQVVDAVTSSVHDLGGQQIHQGSGRIDTIQYAEGASFQGASGPFRLFLCSKFIRLVRLQPTNDFTMNCLDCAHAVGVFASVLGCSLQLLKIAALDAQEISTKPVWLMGISRPHRESFRHHWVARTPETTIARVWDACLKVDLDPAPHINPPVDWGLAAGLVLDGGNRDPSSLAYRRRFLAEDSQQVRLFTTRLGYPDSVPARAMPPTDTIDRDDRRQLIRALARAAWTRLIPGLTVHHLLSGLNADQATPRDETTIEVSIRRYPFVVVPVEASGMAGSTLRVGVLVTAKRVHAVRAFLDFAVQYSAPLFPVAGIGDFAFYCGNDESLLVLWGDLVLAIRNDPSRGVPIIPESQLLARKLERVVLPTI